MSVTGFHNLELLRVNHFCSYEALAPNSSLASNMLAGAFAGIAVRKELGFALLQTY